MYPAQCQRGLKLRLRTGQCSALICDTMSCIIIIIIQKWGLSKTQFGQKSYIKQNNGVKMLKLKLEITEFKANYKGNHENALCRRCGKQDEYLKQLWERSYFQNNYLPKPNSMQGNNQRILNK